MPTITPVALTRVAAVAAIASGLLFAGVQIGHPPLESATIASTEVVVRNAIKSLMGVLALVGITGMYLRDADRNGVLGAVGYLVLALGYLLIVCTTVIGAFVLPNVVDTDAAFVDAVLAAMTGDPVESDIGGVAALIGLQGAAYLLGGLVFGAALVRADVLARWASVLLALGGLITVALSLMPHAFYRLLAFPNAIAMAGLGASLWRASRARTAR